MSDNVHSPKHYQLGDLNIEAIDVIKAVLGEEKFQGYCRGNTIKYILRADKKNNIEDLQKAKVYLDWEIQSRLEEKIKYDSER